MRFMQTALFVRALHVPALPREQHDDLPCRDAMGNAMYTFRHFRESFTGVQLRGMQQDLSWDKAAEQYEQVFLDAKYQW